MFYFFKYLRISHNSKQTYLKSEIEGFFTFCSILPLLQENLPNNTNGMSMMINKCLGDKIGRDLNRFLWNLVRIDRIEDLGI